MPEQKTKSLLNEGHVLAVGPGGIDEATGNLVKPTLKAGQRVLLPQFGGTSVMVGEEEYNLYKESEILAIIAE